jgi:GGDEF domain-containing protein
MVKGFGTEWGEVLLSVQYALAREQQRAERPGWEPVEVPVVAQVLTLPSSASHLNGGGTPVERARPADIVPWNVALVDPVTGAGTLTALLREVDDQAPDTLLAALSIEAIAETRASQGDEVADGVVRALVEAAPFATRARDRIYRIGPDELVLLMRESDEDGAKAAAARLEQTVRRTLSDRRLPSIRLGIHLLDRADIDRDGAGRMSGASLSAV